MNNNNNWSISIVGSFDYIPFYSPLYWSTSWSIDQHPASIEVNALISVILIVVMNN